ncbi:type VII secretion integral membrane protein EccD [Mycolicibacterium thermoresistibile]
MNDSVRRVAVQVIDELDSTVVDLVLPGGVEVAELIPAIADLVGDVDTDADPPAAWQLSRIGGGALDGSRTLTENGVHDGELLLLSTTEFAPVIRRDPDELGWGGDDTGTWPHGIGAAVGLWIAAAGAVAVGWASLLHDDAGRTVPAALLALGAAATLVMYRHRREPVAVTASALIVVLLAAALGLLVVPNGPGAANVLLAAAAGGAAAAMTLRFTRAGTVALVAVAAVAAVLTFSMIPAVLWTVPTVAVGAVMATASIGVLGLAARVSIALAGLTPALGSGDEDSCETIHGDGPMVRGNAILTGLLTGAAITATVGVALVALGPGLGTPWWAELGFAAAVATALLLRVRSHADTQRRCILLACGVCCATVVFAAIIAGLPQQATYPGAVAVAAGLAVVTSLPAASVSPLTRRAADGVEYLALAALLPLACWVAGVYGLVRGLTLW